MMFVVVRHLRSDAGRPSRLTGKISSRPSRGGGGPVALEPRGRRLQFAHALRGVELPGGAQGGPGARAWLCCAFGPLVELAVESRYAYWHRMEFQVAQWKALADHARDREVHFLSSPFSVEAVHLLASLGMPAWKVGSGEIRSRDLIRAVLDAGGPILLSTGMSPWSEIDDAVHFLEEQKAEIVLLQCTSRYPTPLSEVGINAMDDMARRYHHPVRCV